MRSKEQINFEIADLDAQLDRLYEEHRNAPGETLEITSAGGYTKLKIVRQSGGGFDLIAYKTPETILHKSPTRPVSLGAWHDDALRELADHIYAHAPAPLPF